MATFQYIDNQGRTRTVEADDANLALQNATDIARTSGVQLVNQTPQINLSQIQDTTPTQLPQQEQPPVVPPPNFLTTSQIEQTPEDELRQKRTALETEIQTLEQQMANRTTTRNTALGDAGVFDDMRSLTGLRDELRRVQDEEIAIPVRARQDLRGTGATVREFQQRTTPQLENNLLEQLTASRRVSSLTDIINTNINIIDTQLQAQNEREDFIYSQKQKQLQTIETVYGNILTERQKMAVEERKQQWALELETIKSENDLKSSIVKNIISNGGSVSGNPLDMSVGQLSSISSRLAKSLTSAVSVAAMDKDKDIGVLRGLQDLENAINLYEQKVNKYGVVNARNPNSAILDSTYQNALQAYRRAVDLGALQGADIQLVEAAIRPAVDRSLLGRKSNTKLETGVVNSINTAREVIESNRNNLVQTVATKQPTWVGTPYFQDVTGINPGNVSYNQAQSLLGSIPSSNVGSTPQFFSNIKI